MPFAALPLASRLLSPLDELWKAVVPVIGERIFGVNAQFAQLGSGDMPFHYVRLFLWAALAVVVALIWCRLDTKASHYTMVARWFVVFCRFALSFSLISYATAKVIPVQFPTPALDTLVLPIGSASRFTLLYAFMGASAPFQRLVGWIELVSALLLTVRRTALPGALLAVVVLSGVAAVNFSYGVPAKLQVLHLLALAGVVIAPHGRRLLLFVLDRPVPPSNASPLFRSVAVQKGVVVLGTVVVTFVVWTSLHRAYGVSQRFGDAAPRSPLRGIWNVEVFELDGIVRPAVIADAERWRRVVFDDPRVASIYDMSDRREWFHVELRPTTIQLTSNDGRKVLRVAYSRPDRATLILETAAGGSRIRATCRLQDEHEYRLLADRFRWTAVTYDE